MFKFLINWLKSLKCYFDYHNWDMENMIVVDYEDHEELATAGYDVPPAYFVRCQHCGVEARWF